MKKFLSALLLLAAVVLTAAPKPAAAKTLKIAVGGEAATAIVVDDNADRVVWQAARELQNYFRKISSARIPIRNVAYTNSSNIVLGTPESPAIQPVLKGTALKLVKQIKDDGYAVINRGYRL